MKTKLYVLLMMLLAICINVKSFSQANTSLSNLVAPTSVNQDLLPNGDNTHNLGAAAKNWKILYIDSSIYLKGVLFLHSRVLKILLLVSIPAILFQQVHTIQLLALIPTSTSLSQNTPNPFANSTNISY